MKVFASVKTFEALFSVYAYRADGVGIVLLLLSVYYRVITTCT